jgi:hypothetical protein
LRPPSKKKKRGKNLSPRDFMKASHRICTALLKSVAEIGTQSAMKSSRKTSLKYNVFGSQILPLKHIQVHVRVESIYILFTRKSSVGHQGIRRKEGKT